MKEVGPYNNMVIVQLKSMGYDSVTIYYETQTVSIVLRIVCDSGAKGSAYVDNIYLIQVP